MSNNFRALNGNFLYDETSQRESEKISPFDVECVKQVDGMSCHPLDSAGNFSL